MATERPKRGVPEGLWIRCPQCKATVYKKEVEARHHVCPECDHHFTCRPATASRSCSTRTRSRSGTPISGRATRSGSWTASRTTNGCSRSSKTGMPDAAVIGKGFIRGRPVVLGITDFAFMAGSMGSVVGEKLTRAAERATELRCPLIFVSGSGGGARMQEGILSLMQMAKVSAALARYDTGRRAVRLHPDQPDHGRRGRQLGPPGRPDPGGAGGDGRLRGQADHQEHGPAGAARGVPDQRVPAQARVRRPDRPPQDLRTEVARMIDYCQIQ